MFARRRLLLTLVFAALAPVMWIGGCSRAKDPWGEKPTPHILVSVPPLYSFAKSVAGDHGEVKSLCTETGPHHYEASTKDEVLLRGATRFFSVGLTLDDKFADKLVKDTNYDEAHHLELGEKLSDNNKKKLKDLGHEEHKDHADTVKGKDAGHAHEHGDVDPHVWLGTPQAIEMVEMIRDELKKADPAHAADYDKNAAKYVDELKKLHDDGVALLKDKKNKKIISFHESLGYFAGEFGIDIVDVIEDIPGNNPETAKILELVKKCVDENVYVIAVEPQYPKTEAAETIRKKLKEQSKEVVLVEIDPLETAKEGDLSADLYIETMRQNLGNLAKSLK